jgi:hypothetical protein
MSSLRSLKVTMTLKVYVFKAQYVYYFVCLQKFNKTPLKILLKLQHKYFIRLFMSYSCN